MYKILYERLQFIVRERKTEGNRDRERQTEDDTIPGSLTSTFVANDISHKSSAILLHECCFSMSI